MPKTDLGPATTRMCTLITRVDESDLDHPTPCSDYTVGDLLDHIRGATVAFGGAATKAGGATADMGPPATPPTCPRTGGRRSRAALLTSTRRVGTTTHGPG